MIGASGPISEPVLKPKRPIVVAKSAIPGMPGRKLPLIDPIRGNAMSPWTENRIPRKTKALK
jgi:hypothetical protein